MWKRVALAVAAASLIALTVGTPAGAVSASTPFDAEAERICATAEGHKRAGSLDRAKALYTSVKAGDGQQNCAVRGLESVAEQREKAASLVIKGQKLIRSGKFDEAHDDFDSALKLDRGNAKAASGIAQAAVLRSGPITVTASSNWDRFYEVWVKPLGKLLLFSVIALAVLGAMAGLTSRCFVTAEAVAWPHVAKVATGIFGFALTVGAAVMLPLFAMFKPFSPTWQQIQGSAYVLMLIGLLLGIVVLDSTNRPQRSWKHWQALLGCVSALVVVAFVLLLAPLPLPARLLVAYIAYTVLGVILLAAALGQNLRLQVEVQNPDGTVSAASTEYLLARMKTLGTETPKQALSSATSVLSTTPLSKITSEELSALPAGKVAGALSRLLFTLRPDLTWRARATLVDDERVAMALSRNGRHAESAVFSRPDVGLAAIPAGLTEAEKTTAQSQALAQLLTGAAAFILLRLSESHVELQGRLCGARRWKSVALEVIAGSKALIDDGRDHGAERVALLSRAVDEDPGNVMARFEYLWAAYSRIPWADTDSAACAEFAKILDRHYEGCSDFSETKENDLHWAALKIRILYSSATQWINSYLGDPNQDSKALDEAKKSEESLSKLCETVIDSKEKSKQLEEQARKMLRFAKNLHLCIEVLREKGPREEDAELLHPHKYAKPSPRLSYDHACLDCFLSDLEHNDARLHDAVEDLRFALATDEDKEGAASDPCFNSLHSQKEFRKLVGTLPPEHFLDLTLYAPHKKALAEAGITSASDLLRRTRTPEQQDRWWPT